MSSKSKINKLVIAAWFGVGLNVSLAQAHIPIPPKQPSEAGRRLVKTAVPNFNLIDQNGKPFHFVATRGNVVLATFIFTACPDVCPLLSAKLAAIQRALDERNTKDYWLLSITTDPERDSAVSLKEYAARFKADLNHWAFLTGSRAELVNGWKAFGVNVTKTESGQIFHTALTTLIDRQGLRRVDYYGDKWLDQEIIKDIQWLGARK